MAATSGSPHPRLSRLDSAVDGGPSSNAGLATAAGEALAPIGGCPHRSGESSRMIAPGGTCPARESCDQTKTWTIFDVHSQDENGLGEVRSGQRAYVLESNLGPVRQCDRDRSATGGLAREGVSNPCGAIPYQVDLDRGRIDYILYQIGSPGSLVEESEHLTAGPGLYRRIPRYLPTKVSDPVPPTSRSWPLPALSVSLPLEKAADRVSFPEPAMSDWSYWP